MPELSKFQEMRKAIRKTNKEQISEEAKEIDRAGKERSQRISRESVL